MLAGPQVNACGSQCGPAEFVAQSASVEHCTHVRLVGSQRGVGSEHCALEVQPCVGGVTHDPCEQTKLPPRLSVAQSTVVMH